MQNLIDLFINLVKIPSPSGEELLVANFIKEELAKFKIKAELDGTGNKNGSNSGNLVVKLPGNLNSKTLLFVAHMDTVQQGGQQVKPTIKKGIIKSDGTTILGADDKASVACLIEVLKEINTWKKRPTVVAVFSNREENGQLGISFLDLPEKIDYVFNLDGQGKPGSFVHRALGNIPFELEILGKSAHAAIEPEKGINAIKASAMLIEKLKLGRNKEGNYLNIGKIRGGVADNVVPDEVWISGEVRSFTKMGLDKQLKIFEKKLKEICNKTGCNYSLKIKPKEGMPAFSLPKSHKIIKIAREAVESAGLKFQLTEGSFSCEANILAEKYSVLNVCRGGKMAHSTEESITVQELLDYQKLILALVSQFR